MDPGSIPGGSTRGPGARSPNWLLGPHCFSCGCFIVHNGEMVDREAKTLTPPPPEDPDTVHKRLIKQLADHEDPRVRILAHISTRQFELSERITDMQSSLNAGFDELKRHVAQMGRDLGDKIDKLDEGFVDVEERTSILEKREANGSSAPTTQ